jgi:aspartate-semialdehyde dehydrogenase
VVRAHSIAIIAEFEKLFNLKLAAKTLTQKKSIDYFSDNTFPSAIRQSKHDNIGIGRLRKDTCWDNAISMWVVGDQILKGTALNAIQIMECMESLNL